MREIRSAIETYWTVPFFILALAGLALGLISHAAAWVGLPQPLGPFVWTLHVGIFVVWIPAVLLTHRLGADFKQKDFWKAALRGCPPWMRWITYGFCAYAVVNFLLFIPFAPGGGGGAGGIGNAPPIVVRGFSGHWMAFYSMAGAILHSAISVARTDSVRRCQMGHPVGSAANYCELCGAAVLRPATEPRVEAGELEIPKP